MCEVGITDAVIQNLGTKIRFPSVKPKKAAPRNRDAAVDQDSWFK